MFMVKRTCIEVNYCIDSYSNVNDLSDYAILHRPF